MSRETIVAEPLYVLLSLHGCVDAHEKIRIATEAARREKKSLMQKVCEMPDLLEFIVKFTPEQKEILEHPEQYLGKAVEKTEETCAYWRKELGL